MTPLFKKLNFKNHDSIFVLNSPESFLPELAQIKEFTRVSVSLETENEIPFCLLFVQKETQLSEFMEKLKDKFYRDVILWICYPKKASKKYSSELNRDSDWSALANQGFEGVRMISIDADWSALRFRKVVYIKTMKRNSNRALTEAGKRKTAHGT